MSKQPVVFVPGFGGSFNLPVLLDWLGPTLEGWGLPPWLNYGQTFLATFAAAGYTRNKDLFVAFYDWRKSVQDSANTYLIPWIDRARHASGSDKVILVAHSMGGLVSRSYIQGGQYRSDVAKLITLGTPHLGAPLSYYPWEGGEVHADPAFGAIIDIYLRYLALLQPSGTGLDRLAVLRGHIPSVRDLLPTNDYLLNQQSPPQAIPEAAMQQRNSWVALLNQPENLQRLFERTAVTTISGHNFDTVQSIIVGSMQIAATPLPVYPDGTPQGVRSNSEGDGTVLMSSAQFADPRAHNLPPQAIRHVELPDLAVSSVLKELGVAAPPAAAMATAPGPRLVIMAALPVEISVTTPPSAKGTPHPPVRLYHYGRRGRRISLAVIDNPAAGEYPVHVRGTARGGFALGAMLLDAEGVPAGAPIGLAAENSAMSGQIAPAEATGTIHGDVAAETELYYQVVLTTSTAQPQIRFDTEATTQNALSRMRQAVPALAQAAVMDDPGAPAVQMRLQVGVETIAGTGNLELAQALAEQLKQISQHAGIGDTP